MAFEPISRTRIADQIATRIRDAILGGRFDPGDALPPERDLAGQFGVNRSSIREALRRLEAWGLVEIRHGGGSRVADFLATAGLHLLPFLIAPGGQLDPKLLHDLLELRAVLLGWTAQRAAERSRTERSKAQERGGAEQSKAQKGAEGANTSPAGGGAAEGGGGGLRHILDQLEAATTLAERQALDFAFFEQLVAMTDNRVLALISNAIRRVYLENARLFEALYADFDTSHHRRALAAIAEGRADDAREAMTAYARGVLATGEPCP